MKSRRIAITGIGAVTPLGNDLQSTWQALLDGKSGIGPVRRCDVTDIPCKTAGELKGFGAEDFIDAKDVLRYDPFVHYASAAALMARVDAGLVERDLAHAGVVVGSSRGGISSIERAVNSKAGAYLMPGTTVSMGASYVSRILGARGPVLGISNACASGANAVGEAMRLIREGYADVMVAGGAEAPITPITLRGYGAAGALSKSAQMRPFDTGRDGFVIAEGGAVVILEEYKRAQERGAGIYAEVLGYGNTSDAHHATVPEPGGQEVAIRLALKEAGVERVDYVNAHATATPLGDASEARAISAVLSEAVPVSATKSMTGHMLGASGAFEAAVAALSIRHGRVHPTINLNESDCPLNHVTQTTEVQVQTAVSNSFGFGGVNAVLVLGKPSG